MYRTFCFKPAVTINRISMMDFFLVPNSVSSPSLAVNGIFVLSIVE